MTRFGLNANLRKKYIFLVFLRKYMDEKKLIWWIDDEELKIRGRTCLPCCELSPITV